MKYTSGDQILALIHELRGHLIIANELLEAHAVQCARAEVEESGDAEEDDGDREVDVEAAADELDHVHVTHDLENVQEMFLGKFIPYLVKHCQGFPGIFFFPTELNTKLINGQLLTFY